MTVLYVLLGIIAFFVLIFSVRLTIYATYDEEFKFDVKWTFIKLPIYPAKDKPKKEKKKKEKPKQEEAPVQETAPKQKKDNILTSFYKNQGFGGVMQLLNDTVGAINGMFGGIFKHFIFRELKLYVAVGAGDAADTAVLYGKTCAVVYPAFGLITSTCKVKEYDCNVEPNFLGAQKSATFRAVCSLRPIFVTNSVVVLAFKLLFKVVLKLLKNKPKAQKSVEPTQNENNIKEEHKQ